MYIDKTYYDDTYLGTPIDDVAEFNRTAQRASDVIDRLTHYRIDESTLSAFQLNQLKMATAVLVEHYAMNGGYDAVMESEGMASVNVGSFSYSSNSGVKVPTDVISHLSTAGLIYSGIGTYHG
ncbi:hypothetical protein [Oceanobacillus sp. CF4.6]|uniref:hypothetical protein n=1 Tax=Oceanobacillus sp. CF4.6 TaxID=3373080 RepID=UPI003EE6044F